MATKETKDGLGYIIQAISNIVEPKVADLRYDKTYRAKVTEKVEAGIYKVKINGREYQLEYKGDLNVEDIVRVKAPLNNFSDIYIEAEPSTGGGSGSTSDYNDLLNKPILNTNNSLSLEVNNNETLKGNISLHKISKTGSYNDLNNLPDLNFIPTKEKGANNGVASLGADSRVPKAQLPTDVVYDNDYVHTNNNFTNDLKTKLDGIEAGAQQNTIDGIQRNGTPIQIKNKVVNILVPTKTSDLENDNNFVSDSNYIHTDNNFTNTLKNKLDGIEAGAEVNIINTIQKNGVPLSVSNKTVNVIVPTKTSDLTNDSGFIKEIPVASASVLGGIKVGANLNIEADGTLNAVGGGGGTNITKTSELTNDGEDGSSPYATQQYVGTQIASKQNTIKGAATTITDNNLTANRALISDNNGKVAVSSVTNTELGYLDGVTSNLQTQIDSKQPKITENSAFNKNFETAVANIKMDGVASLGTSSNIPRSDHVHPTDTTRTQAHGNTNNYLYSCVSNSTGAETLDQSPDAYYYEGVGRYRELKSSTAIGLQNEQEYVQLETIVWSDEQGMFFGGMQLAYGNSIWYRVPGITNWGSWSKIGLNSSNLVSTYVLPNDTNIFTMNGLDIDRDGGIYDIYMQFQVDSANDFAFAVRINGIDSNTYDYSGIGITRDSTTFSTLYGTATNALRLGAKRGNYSGFIKFTIIKAQYSQKPRFMISATSYSSGINSEFINGVFTPGSDINLTSLEFLNITNDNNFIKSGTKIFVYKR